MKLKDALKRIEELERKVKELEARPAQHLHYYYHQQPSYYPTYPYYQPWPTIPQGPTWTIGAISGKAGDQPFFNVGASSIASYGPDH